MDATAGRMNDKIVMRLNDKIVMYLKPAPVAGPPQTPATGRLRTGQPAAGGPRFGCRGLAAPRSGNAASSGFARPASSRGLSD